VAPPSTCSVSSTRVGSSVARDRHRHCDAHVAATRPTWQRTKGASSPTTCAACYAANARSTCSTPTYWNASTEPAAPATECRGSGRGSRASRAGRHDLQRDRAVPPPARRPRRPRRPRRQGFAATWPTACDASSRTSCSEWPPTPRSQRSPAGRTLHSISLSPMWGSPSNLRLRNGVVSGDLGEPDRRDVELKMRAEILDGMFTGRVNAMQAATGGTLSFSGDTVKAMTLQQIQADMGRLYAGAGRRRRSGDLSPRPRHRLPRRAPRQRPDAGRRPIDHHCGPPRVGDVRDEMPRGDSRALRGAA